MTAERRDRKHCDASRCMGWCLLDLDLGRNCDQIEAAGGDDPMTDVTSASPLKEITEFTTAEIAALVAAVDVLCSQVSAWELRHMLSDVSFDAVRRARSVVRADPVPAGPPGLMAVRVAPFRVVDGGDGR